MSFLNLQFETFQGSWNYQFKDTALVEAMRKEYFANLGPDKDPADVGTVIRFLDLCFIRESGRHADVANELFYLISKVSKVTWLNRIDSNDSIRVVEALIKALDFVKKYELEQIEFFIA